jgi:hypothetical protein
MREAPVSVAGITASRTLGIAVFPVDLPAYLDRPQIVSRTGANTLRFAEYHKWAEPLGAALRNVLADNLARRFPNDYVFVQPGRKPTPYDYGIEVRIRRFEGVAGRDNGQSAKGEGKAPPPSSSTFHLLSSSFKQAVLLADWTVYPTESDSPVLRRSSSLTTPLEGRSYTALVAGLSRLADELARDIAAAIDQLATSKAQPPARN